MTRSRTTMTGGKVMTTAGVNALPTDGQPIVIRRVATFSNFNSNNDPHGEHDFVLFTLAGETFFWRIDYYDTNMKLSSEDPADPTKTTRVLIIMFGEEH
jgi:hypothetical protein